jgi:hypothetical protein
LKTNPTLAGPLYGRGMAKLRKGEVAGANADIAAAKEINPKISDSFAAYSVRTETALPALEAPVATSSTRPEPIAPAAEAPANRAAPAEPAAPPPAAEITTTVPPPQSGPVKSTSPATFPAPVAPPPAADCSSAETHWKSAESIGTLAAYSDHLARFPNCVFSTLAAVRIEALKK